MLTQSLRRIVLPALLILLTCPAFASGPASRIGTVKSTVTSTVPGSAHPLARPEFDWGTVEDDMPLSGLAINFQRSAAQQSALETLIEGQHDPNSPLFHQWLTQAQFAAQFGMSAEDIATATAWLQSQGFSVAKVVDSGNAILFTGTAGQVRHAFGTEIHHYEVKGVTHYANASAVTLPAALAGVVSGVSGLDDFKPSPQSVRAPASAATGNNTGGVSPLFTSGISGTHFLTPGDFNTIYDVTPLLNGGFTGTGVVIGIAGETDIVPSDITTFRAAAGLPVNNPTIVLKPGSHDPGIIYAEIGEADLDLEWSGGIAPNASVVFLNSTDVFGSLMYGIQNQVTVNGSSVIIPILSISYGACEALQSGAVVTSMELAFQQAIAQGQTVIAASADSGATDCDSANTLTAQGNTTQGLAVDYPASSAYVTGIGGTEFNEGNATGGTTYWNANGSTDVISSAISYIPETVWNDTPTAALVVSDGGLLASGGGKSTLFAKPTWQAGVTGIPVDGQRDVPDISFNASPVHDPYLVCTQIQLASGPIAGNCGNGFRIADGSASDTGGLQGYGGTSLGAPSFAGVLAVMEQKLGGPQGLLNKALYSIASNATIYSGDFHDTKIGNNAEPCSTGTGCVSGVAGFNAGTGYDQATGLGSIDANSLATGLQAYALANGGKVGTKVVVNYSPIPPMIGASVTLSATVTQNSGSVVPTGTVTFSIDNGASTLAPATIASGVATATTTFSTGGLHTVTARYSGDSTNFPSAGSTTVSGFTNAAGSAATTTVLTSPSSTATFYSSTAPTFTATVTSTAGGSILGSVLFTIGTGATAVSTNVPVTSSVVGVGTATFTPVSVTAATGFSGSGTTNVIAQYSGTTAYQQSTSNTLPITVTTPSYTIAANTLTISSALGAPSSNATVTVTSINGFNDPVTLTLTVPNSLSGCGSLGLLSSTVTPTPSTPATTTIVFGSCPAGSSVTQGTLVKTGGVGSLGWSWATGGLIALLCMAGFAGRRRTPRLVAVLAIALLGGLMLGASGCGGGTVTSSGIVPGTYTATLTGSDAVNSLIPPVSTTFQIIVH